MLLLLLWDSSRHSVGQTVIINTGQMVFPPENSASFSRLLDESLLSSSMHLMPAKTCCALLREIGKAGRKQSFSASRPILEESGSHVACCAGSDCCSPHLREVCAFLSHARRLASSVWFLA